MIYSHAPKDNVARPSRNARSARSFAAGGDICVTDPTKEKSRAETDNVQRGARPVPDTGLQLRAETDLEAGVQFESGPDIGRLGLGVGAFRMADAGSTAEAEDESLSESSGSSFLCGYMPQPTSAQIVEAEQVRTRDTRDFCA